MEEANRAFSRHDIATALEISLSLLERIDTTPVERASAARLAALIQWRYQHDYQTAQESYGIALASGKQLSDTWLAMSRMELHRLQIEHSLQSASLAAVFAETKSELEQARIQYARAIILPLVRSTLGNEQELTALTENRLRHAHTLIKRQVMLNPGALQSSELMLYSSILLDEWQQALIAWRSYYRIAEGFSRGAIIDSSNQRIQQIISEGADANNTIEEFSQLVIALADSRHFTAAALVAHHIPAEKRSSAVQDVCTYAQFTLRLKAITDEYYRQTSLGKGDFPAYQRELFSLLETCWHRLHWTSEEFPLTKPFTKESLMNQLEGYETISDSLSQQYGAYLTMGDTAGYMDLHYGHVIVDETRSVEQYGYTSEVIFIQLDRMVSNGFQSWAWDYGSQHGGWAKSNTIYQVRPAYAEKPVKIWRRLSDRAARDRWEEKIRDQEIRDLRIAANKPHGYLPGMRSRMIQQEYLKMLQHVRAEVTGPGEVRKRFLAAVEEAVLEYSIFAHEGRHLIDQKLGITDSAELEFRAKLSEIAFAVSPRLAFASAIYSSNIGSETPHGQAGQRIVEGVLGWMTENSADIQGMDSTQPLILQLSKLSNQQLVAAVRSLDPLAEKVALTSDPK